MVVEITCIRANYVTELCTEIQCITLRISQMEKGTELVEMLCPVGEKFSMVGKKQ